MSSHRTVALRGKFRSPPQGARPIGQDEDLWAQPLQCVPELLHSFGVNLDTVTRHAGIPSSILDDPENRISFADIARLLGECAAVTDCPHFGLLVGQRSGLAAAGIVGRLARHSVSVRHALRVLITHLHLHDRGAVLSLLQRSHREVELAYVMYHANTPGARHIAEAALAISIQFMHTFCGARWRPTEVTFACAQPRDVLAYRKLFGTAARFNAARFAIAFRANWLDRPIAGADPKERLRLAKLVAELETSRSGSLTERTREALGQMLIALPPSVERIARVLGVSRRTLNRGLAREGNSVKALLEDARYALARQLLEETRMPVSDIAGALHYTTPSAFSRAFRQWTGGVSPRRFRAAARAPRAERENRQAGSGQDARESGARDGFEPTLVDWGKHEQ
jgi:AraC-like DNA-binding protein